MHATRPSRGTRRRHRASVLARVNASEGNASARVMASVHPPLDERRSHARSARLPGWAVHRDGCAMTIVVTGTSGFLGRRVLACCNAHDDEVVGVSIDDDAIATIRTREPDAVIHLAAVNPGLGDAAAIACANVDLTHAVAIAAAVTGARLVHVSTDVVHDGTAAPYADDARPQPFGDYAALEGRRRSRGARHRPERGRRAHVVALGSGRSRPLGRGDGDRAGHGPRRHALVGPVPATDPSRPTSPPRSSASPPTHNSRRSAARST